MEKEYIEIDGSKFEGGGQIIRNSLALSVILNKSIKIINIRTTRPNPGINNQLKKTVQFSLLDKLF